MRWRPEGRSHTLLRGIVWGYEHTWPPKSCSNAAQASTIPVVSWAALAVPAMGCAVVRSTACTCVGVRWGSCSKRRATMPVTCAAANELPDRNSYASCGAVVRISIPGAASAADQLPDARECLRRHALLAPEIRYIGSRVRQGGRHRPVSFSPTLSCIPQDGAPYSLPQETPTCVALV